MENRGGHGGSRSCQCLSDASSRRLAGGGAKQNDAQKGRQRAAIKCGGKGGAAGVGDLGAVEVEHLELRQHSSRRRQRTCRRRRRRQEGGEALVAERVVLEIE